MEISEVSNVVRGLQHGYELHRVCFPEEVKTSVQLYHRRGLRVKVRGWRGSLTSGRSETIPLTKQHACAVCFQSLYCCSDLRRHAQELQHQSS
jgi:hypothetical protein